MLGILSSDPKVLSCFLDVSRHVTVLDAPHTLPCTVAPDTRPMTFPDTDGRIRLHKTAGIRPQTVLLLELSSGHRQLVMLPETSLVPSTEQFFAVWRANQKPYGTLPTDPTWALPPLPAAEELYRSCQHV